MTQEDKELLLIDLCARWPYNNLIVRVSDMNDPSYQEEGKLRDIKYMDIDCNGIPFLFDVENVFILCDITEIKPYLRPMSTMTTEERFMFNGLCNEVADFNWEIISHKIYDWLNKRGFDYRGLIPKGLALPAPVGMY